MKLGHDMQFYSFNARRVDPPYGVCDRHGKQTGRQPYVVVNPSCGQPNREMDFPCSRSFGIGWPFPRQPIQPNAFLLPS